MRYSDEDWKRIGHNVHTARIVRGTSQEELAQRAGISITTLHRVEKGLSIRQSSLRAIAQTLDHPIDSVINRRQQLMTTETGPLVHRWEGTVWSVADERRSKVPEDDFARIQKSEERARLGRLGLVGAFVSSMNFIMPDGPGPNFFEVFSRIEDSINHEIYRDALIFCTQGPIRLSIRDRIVTMNSGDVAGLRTDELEWIEPDEGAELPARFTWVGAVRVGLPPPGAVQNAQRAKRRRKEPAP